MSTLHFNVAGDPHEDVPTLITDNPPGGTQLAAHFSGGPPPNRWSVTCPPAFSGGATVTYAGSSSIRVILPPGPGDWEAGQAPCLPPEYGGDASKMVLDYRSAHLEELQIVGDHFEQRGKRWLVRGVDGFCDLAILLDAGHGALEPQLQQAQDLGARVRRIFGCIKNIRQFNPFNYGAAYFEAITELAALYQAHGLYLDFDGLPDTGYWGFSLQQCQDLWAQQIVTFGPIVNKFNLSLTNEWDHGGNLVGSLDDYTRPPFALCSQGSAVSDTPPPRPGWGIREFHCLKPWPKIFLCEDMLFNREGVDADGHRWGEAKPTYLSECARFEEGLPHTDERLARTLAFETIGLGEGFILHNEFGKDGRMMQPRVARCVETAMRCIADAEG